MTDFKELILTKMAALFLKLQNERSYNYDSSNGLKERIEDFAKYDQLKELVRSVPEWDEIELAQELSERIREKPL